MRLSFDRLWIWIAIALPAFVSLLVPMPAVDLAYQVRAGNEILATGMLPGVDTWTFTVAGTPWLDQQWLAQVLLALGHRAGGWELLYVLRAVLVVATTGMLILVALARGASPRTSAILALVAFMIGAPALALRPQLFGLVLFAGLLWLVAVRQRRPAVYLIAPVLIVLWGNLHGSFVLGPVLLGYAWLDDVLARRPSRRSLIVLIAGAMATLVNPFGIEAWSYAIGIGANPAIANQVSEWQRTSPLTVPGALFYGSLVVTCALMLRRRSTVPIADWLLAACMALLGAWAERGVVWWALVMVFLVAAVLPATQPRRSARASVLNAVTAAVLGVLILVALPWWRAADPLTGRAGILSYAPSGLAARVAELATPGTRVLVPQTWGSWFEWAAPDASYFIDSRFELFPPPIWDDNAALEGPEAATVIDRWGVEVLVVPAGEASPAGDWVVDYTDEDGTVLVRGS